VAAVVVCTDGRTATGAEKTPSIDTERWQRLAVAVLQDEAAEGELTLTFVDADDIADLNATHMGTTGPTDVLSFPLDDEGMPGVPVLLGDVVVCPAVAAAQSGDHAGTFDDELALLVVHGVLHVLGYDHAEPDEEARMRSREHELLVDHHWRGPAPPGFRHEQD
jgi:probable rRNA maturation factor